VDQLSRLGDKITAGSAIRFAMARAQEPRTLSSETQQHLLKIVEEAIRNAVRHASATEIVVDTSIEPNNRLHIHIRDNGIGFEVNSESGKPGHWGLTSMRERAQAIGGTLNLSSILGQGTTIEVSVAIKGRWKTLKVARSGASAS
jgi:signal transduction histidine kinase